jgi:hypothetical protein
MAGGIMKYARVTHAQMDAAKDLVVLTLMRAGITKSNYEWDKAFNLLMEAPNKAVLCKSLIKHQRYVYNSLAEI